MLFKLVCAMEDLLPEETYCHLTAEEAVDLAEVKLEDYYQVLIQAEV